MKKIPSILVVVAALLFAVSAIAQNKIVIVPQMSLLFSAEKDCNGDKNGTAYLDTCAICVGGNTGLTACTQDCNGDWGGTATTDNCAICVGGNTGLTACTQDCNGDWGGTAYLDSCNGSCVGGNTGQSSLVTCVTSVGQVWMDRNLGASQVATSYDDAAAYGDLYQWGRLADGHQSRTSAITAITSGNDVPGNSNFITPIVPPYDWRVPQNDNLWQGLGGVNNPCPQGFRLPTEAEWEVERASWSSNDAAGAFASPLKIVLAGHRNYANGTTYDEGNWGWYWSSTVNGTLSRNLHFSSGSAFMNDYNRADGMSVRCIQDVTL